VILLKISEADAVKRAAARQVCGDCGAIFNKLTKVPFMENLCDSCGGKLKLRDDDKPDAVKKRLMVYRDQTEQLISYYRSNEKFFEIDAAQAIAVVTAQIYAALKAK
jgi:adenylate kinase